MTASTHQPHLAAPSTQPPLVLKNVSTRSGHRWHGDSRRARGLGADVRPPRPVPRAALVVVSDGADTASDVTLRQLRDVLRRTEPFVYAIAIDAPGALVSTRMNLEALRKITSRSGGYTEVVRAAENLGPATERMANELNKQYMLGYVVATAGRRVEGDSCQGEERQYRTRARREYYATAARSSTSLFNRPSAQIAMNSFTRSVRRQPRALPHAVPRARPLRSAPPGMVDRWSTHRRRRRCRGSARAAECCLPAARRNTRPVAALVMMSGNRPHRSQQPKVAAQRVAQTV